MTAERVVVSGGRYFRHWRLFHSELLNVMEQVGGFDMMAHGGARGVDTLAGRFAKKHRIPCQVFEAQWSLIGARAGAIRNGKMLEEFKPTLLVLFPGGRGTADMRRQAICRGGLQIKEITMSRFTFEVEPTDGVSLLVLIDQHGSSYYERASADAVYTVKPELRHRAYGFSTKGAAARRGRQLGYTQHVS